MARNGSGTYSKVNTFVAGSTITASGHNQNWDDIVSEMTNSVAADGQTTMTGPLKLASGTAAAPSMAFGSDLDTGIYRIGSNEVGLSIGGSKVLDVSSSGLDVTGALKQNSISVRPVGEITAYAGSSAPSGWLLCDGSNVSRTTYASLFAVIGTTYGPGDGSTTFAVPDCTGRVLAGKESSATRLTNSWFGADSTVLGSTGGNEKNALSSTNQLPQFTPSGSVTPNAGGPNPLAVAAGSGVTPFVAGSTIANGYSTGTFNTLTASFSGNAVGSASPSSFRTCQPTIICNYIIFAGA